MTNNKKSQKAQSKRVLTKNMPRKTSPAAKQTPQRKRRTFFFAYKAKTGAAHKTRGAAARGEKNGIYGGNVHQHNISPSIFMP